MHYLHKYLEFNTIEDGEKMLKEAISIREQMGGALYYGMLSEDCNEIFSKLQNLKNTEYLKNLNNIYY